MNEIITVLLLCFMMYSSTLIINKSVYADQNLVLIDANVDSNIVERNDDSNDDSNIVESNDDSIDQRIDESNDESSDEIETNKSSYDDEFKHGDGSENLYEYPQGYKQPLLQDGDIEQE